MKLLLLIYICLKPDTTVKAAAHVATHASTMLNRTNTLINFAHGEDLDGASPVFHHQEVDGASPMLGKGETCYTNQGQGPPQHRASLIPQHLLLQAEYIDEETGALNKKRRRFK